MKSNYITNQSKLAKVLGISRNSLIKAVKSGKIPKTENGFYLDCPYIHEKMFEMGVADISELLVLDEKTIATKKAAKKSVKKNSKAATTKASIKKIPKTTAAAVSPSVNIPESSSISAASSSELQKEKIEIEIEIRKKKLEEIGLKVERERGDSIPKAEAVQNFRQTFTTIDTTIRNSAGSGAGQQLLRLADDVQGKTTREKIAAFNELFSKIVADSLATAYSTLKENVKEIEK